MMTTIKLVYVISAAVIGFNQVNTQGIGGLHDLVQGIAAPSLWPPGLGPGQQGGLDTGAGPPAGFHELFDRVGPLATLLGPNPPPFEDPNSKAQGAQSDAGLSFNDISSFLNGLDPNQPPVSDMFPAGERQQSSSAFGSNSPVVASPGHGAADGTDSLASLMQLDFNGAASGVPSGPLSSGWGSGSEGLAGGSSPMKGGSGGPQQYSPSNPAPSLGSALPARQGREAEPAKGLKALNGIRGARGPTNPLWSLLQGRQPGTELWSTFVPPGASRSSWRRSVSGQGSTAAAEESGFVWGHPHFQMLVVRSLDPALKRLGFTPAATLYSFSKSGKTKVVLKTQSRDDKTCYLLPEESLNLHQASRILAARNGSTLGAATPVKALRAAAVPLSRGAKARVYREIPSLVLFCGGTADLVKASYTPTSSGDKRASEKVSKLFTLDTELDLVVTENNQGQHSPGSHGPLQLMSSVMTTMQGLMGKLRGLGAKVNVK